MTVAKSPLFWIYISRGSKLVVIKDSSRNAKNLLTAN